MSNTVAIIVPQHRFPLRPDEEISLRHLRKFLGHYDRYLIGPRRLPDGFDDFQFYDFPPHFFTSEFGYNSLLVSKFFYEAFAQYEFILIYQLDCLVFEDQLKHWCEQPWDYIGAPFFHDTSDEIGNRFYAVGNGGFSLRRVQSSLRVLSSRRLMEDPVARGRNTRFFPNSAKLRNLTIRAKTLAHRVGYKNNIRWLLRQTRKHPGFHEDFFWSFEAPKFLPEFRIPSPMQALKFSFEMAPRTCLKLNHGQLPFGCHAWAKWGRDLWEPYLLK